MNANPDNSEFHPSVVKMKAKLAEYSAKQEAAVAALEKKQAGANGGVAVFASEPFDGWKPVEAKTAGLDCEHDGAVQTGADALNTCSDYLVGRHHEA